ncbi:MAG: hypothetical protein A3F43_01220 [Gammaproteobacteria bacterium RIFCSPHIGHO2_12_FULL_42_10]|nr:MAG: hypothetical protein A3F43_01220 [Gammaproteobacteria bacterium RIFCSPHIGHO2_12_FULL_42_10]
MNKDAFEKLQEAYTLRGIALHQLHERVASLEEEIVRLKELLQLQQERLFGKKSETSSSILHSPISAIKGAHSTESIPESKTTAVKSHVRHVPPRGKRQLDISHLPKYTVMHDLLDAEKGLVVFEFSLTRKGSVADERLKEFKGLIQTDGYAGYTVLRKRDGIR